MTNEQSTHLARYFLRFQIVVSSNSNVKLWRSFTKEKTSYSPVAQKMAFSWTFMSILIVYGELKHQLKNEIEVQKNIHEPSENAFRTSFYAATYEWTLYRCTFSNFTTRLGYIPDFTEDYVELDPFLQTISLRK